MDGAWRERYVGLALGTVELEVSEGHPGGVVQQGGNADQKLRSLLEIYIWAFSASRW